MPAPITGYDVVAAALYECGAFAQGETVATSDANWVLDKLNRLADSWDSDGLYIYSVDFLGGWSNASQTPQYNLIPSVQPLTIGEAVVVTAVETDGQNPNKITFTAKNRYKVGDTISTDGIGVITGVDFDLVDALVTGATPTLFTALAIVPSVLVVSTPVSGLGIYSSNGNVFPNYPTVGQRPTKILNANIILNNVSPIVKVPIHVRDDDWWSANSVPTTPTTLPTDLYYSANWPNGSIYLWPLQTSTYGLELEAWTNLLSIPDLTTQFYLPQGYWDAVVYSLAESLIPSYQVPMSIAQSLRDQAQRARTKIRQLNSASPKIRTQDFGIPSNASKNRSMLNWLSGQVVPPR